MHDVEGDMKIYFSKKYEFSAGKNLYISGTFKEKVVYYTERHSIIQIRAFKKNTFSSLVNKNVASVWLSMLISSYFEINTNSTCLNLFSALIG